MFIVFKYLKNLFNHGKYGHKVTHILLNTQLRVNEKNEIQSFCKF